MRILPKLKQRHGLAGSASELKRLRRRRSAIELLEDRRLLVGSSWSNGLTPLNVNDDPLGLISPVDVLQIINELNGRFISDRNTGSLPPTSPTGLNPPPFVDVNCDRIVSPLDSLLVVNHLNGAVTPKGPAFTTSSGESGSFTSLGCGAILREHSSLVTTLTVHLEIPDNAAGLAFELNDLEFDRSSTGSMQDAFEVALLDSQGRSLVHGISPGRDAYYNVSENTAALATTQVSVSARRVELSLQDVLPGTTAELVFRLVNNDLDQDSAVAIRGVEFVSVLPGGELNRSQPASVSGGAVVLPSERAPGPSALSGLFADSVSRFPEVVAPSLNAVSGRAPTSPAVPVGSGQSLSSGLSANGENNPTLIDSRGTEFWFGFPDNLHESGNTPKKLLYITGDLATTGFVEIPGLVDPATSLPFRAEFVVNPGEVTFVELPSNDPNDNETTQNDFDVEAELIAAVQQRGVHVVTLEPVTVYGISRAIATTDAFLALPVSSLGTEYINLGYGNTHKLITSPIGSQLLVVATQDNTQVAISPGSYTFPTPNSNVGIQRPSGNFVFNTGSTNGSSFGPFVADAAGQWKVSVSPPVVGYSGQYDFQLVDLASAAISKNFDELVTASFPTGRESRVFSFDIVAGQQLYFDAINVSGKPAQLALVSPSGQTTTLSPSNDNNTLANLFGALQFRESGKWFVLATGTGAAPFELNFKFIDLAQAPLLSFGQRVSGTDVPIGQSTAFRIQGRAGQRVLFDSLTNHGGGNFVLYGPGGQAIVNNITPNADVVFTLPETATYHALFTQINVFQPYSYDAQLIDLGTVPLLPLTPVSVTYNLGSSDEYRVPAQAGQTLILNTQANLGRTEYRLFDPAGNRVNGSSNGANQSFRLLSSGEYHLVVGGAFTVDSGSVTFQASFTADPVVTPTGLNALQTLSIAPGGSSSYQFTAAAGTPFLLDGRDTVAENLNIELKAPDGTRIFTGFGNAGEVQDIPNNGPALLPQSGVYTVTLRGNDANAQGSYAFRPIDLSSGATPLTLGTTVTGNLAQGREIAAYRFDAAAGQKFSFDGLAGNGAFFAIYDRFLTNVYSHGFGTNLVLDGMFRAPSDGPYYVVLFGAVNNSVDFSFRLQDVAALPLLNFGQRVNGTLNPGTSMTQFRLQLQAGQRIRYESFSPSIASSQVRVENLGGRFIFGGSASQDFGPRSYFPVPESGEYVLSIQGTQNSLTAYDFRVDDLDLAPIAAFDTDISFSLSAQETRTYRVQLQQGDQLEVDNVASQRNNLNWALFGENSENFGGHNDGGDFSTTVSKTGTYYFLINSRDNGTIPIQFRLKRTPATSVPLSGVNQVINLTVGIRETAEHSFSVPFGSILFVNAIKSDFGIRPHNVVLQKGETYLLQDPQPGIFDFNPDLSGTIITSDKPIAVMGGNRATFIPTQFFAADHLVEQLPPTSTWGREFVTMPLATGTTVGDRFRFLAQADNTRLTINGIEVATLNRGEYHEQLLKEPSYVLSSEPILVAQYAQSQEFYRNQPGGSANFLGDPFMMLVPPFEQFLASYTVTTPAEDSIPVAQRFDRNFINILAPNEAVGSIEVDGVAIPSTQFTPIGDSGFSGTQYPVALGAYVLTGPLPFGAFVYGFGSFDSYGYLGGQSLAPVASVASLTLSPTAAAPQVNQTLNFTARVADANGQPLSGVRVDWQVAGIHPQRSFGFSDQNGSVSFSYIGTNSGRDVVTASVGQLLDDTVVDWGGQAEPPQLTILAPSDGSVVPAGTELVATGFGLADFPNATIDLITVNGVPVESVDGAGNFFVRLFVGPGENEYEFTLLDSAGQLATQTVKLTGQQLAPNTVDFTQFADVSGSFAIEYSRTSYNQSTKTIFAETSVRNSGQFPTDVPLLVAIANLSDPSVLVREADGLTPDGLPYYDFSGLVSGGALNPGGQTGLLSASFYNPHQTQFTYDLLFFGKLNQPPQITSLPVILADLTKPYRYDVVAAEANQEPLSYALLESPATMTIDPSTGSIRWNPTVTDAGEHTVEVEVRDPRQGVARQRFSLQARAATGNRPPLFTSLPEPLIEVGRAYPYVAAAIDADADTLTYSLISGPTGMSIVGSTGAINWTPTAAQLGEHAVVVAVSDGRGGEARQAFSTLVISATDNLQPVIVNHAPEAISLSGLSHQFLALDADQEPLSFRLLQAPAGMQLSASGLLTWAPSVANLGSHLVHVEVLDPRGGRDSQQFSLAVFDNQSPVILSTPVIQASVGSDYVYQLLVQDDVDDMLSFQLLDAPVGMTITSNTGLIRWSVPTSAYDLERVKVAVKDGRGGVATQQFTISVTSGQTSQFNRNPSFINPTPVVASVGTKLLMTAQARDPDGDAVHYDLPLGPAGMVIDAATGQLGWLPRADQGGMQQVVIRASDGQGGIWLQSFQINVDLLNTSPSITSQPLATAGVGQPWEYRIHAQDADLDPLLFELLGAPAGMQINPLQGADAAAIIQFTPTVAGQLTLQLRVSDGRGGIVTQNLELQVAESTINVPPAFDSSPRLSIPAGEPWIYAITATDANSDPLTFQLLQGPSGMVLDPQLRLVSWSPTSSQLGNQHVLLQVSDGRGGAIQQDFVVEVISQSNSTTPRIVSPPSAFRATLGETFAYDLRAADEDGDAVEWLLIDAPHGTSLDPRYGTLRWTPTLEQLGQQSFVVAARDPAGNEGLQSFSILVSGANLGPRILSRAPGDAVVDERYVYGVRAVDPENNPLTFALKSAPNGMTIDDQRGVIRWTPTPGQVGLVRVTVEVRDIHGQIAEQSFEIAVNQVERNQAPSISSRPMFRARATAEYSYQVQARDPEGEALSYQLLQAPAGMQINANSGLIRWVPTIDQVGSHLVRVVAIDASGNQALQRFALQVRANLAPIIVSAAPNVVSLGGKYRYDLRVEDPESDSLTFELLTAPSGMTIDPQGRIEWSTGPGVPLTQPVVIQVTDSFGATAQQSYTLQVVPDTTAPTLELLFSANPLVLGETSLVVVQASDDVGITELTLTRDGVPLVLDANRTVKLDGSQPGLFSLEAIARDASGNIGRRQAILRVFDPADTLGPVINLTSPQPGSVVTTLTDIVGSITDDNLQFYRIDYGRADLVDVNQPAADDPDYRTLATGNANAVDAVLATFDPTMLVNDDHVIRILAQDLSGNVSAKTLPLSLDGQLKLGQFSLDFVDLSIPVAGIPITVTRSYDTRNASESGDFGYGWTLSVSDPQIRESLPVNPLEEEGLFFAATPFREGTRVYLTNPEGRRVGFTFRPQRQFSIFGGGSFSATFVPDPGVYDQLDVGQPQLRKVGNGFYDGFFGNPFNPSAYRLTTKDGTVYEYGQFSGLDNITDRNGNRLEIRPDGIFSTLGPAIEFVRDPQGRISRIIDPAGNSLTYVYDLSGNLVVSTNQSGLSTFYSYFASPTHYLKTVVDANGNLEHATVFDAQGRLSSLSKAAVGTTQIRVDLGNSTEFVTDPEGRTTTFIYDAMGNVRSVTNDAGSTTRFEFDSNHNVIATIDPLGNKSSRKLDDRGNTTESTDALGFTFKVTYNASNFPTQVLDPLGRLTVNVYDEFSQVVAIIDAQGNRSSVVRDQQGRVQILEDRGGNITIYEYGSSSVPIRIANPDGTTTHASHNVFAEPLTFTDENGNIRTATYDAMGRLLTEKDGLGGQTQYLYEGIRLTGVINPLGEKRQYLYDTANRRSGEIDPLGGRRAFQYDSKNLMTLDVDPNGYESRFTYGRDGNLESFTDGAGKTTRYAYDLAGNRLAVIDPLGRTVRYEYDANNRLIRETDPSGGVTHFEYDAVDNLVAVTDENGHTTRYHFDQLNRLVEVVDALGRSSKTAYDSRGNVVASTDGNGNVTRFAYDSRSRLISQTDALGGTQRYVYDGVGNVTERTDALGNTTHYTYDGGTPSRLDDLGRNTAVRDQVSGRLISVTSPDGGSTQIAYDSAGNMTEQVDPIGRVTTFAYDALGRQVRINHPDGNSTQIHYDPAGNTTAVIDPIGNVTRFSYNGVGQVLSRIDPVGNVTTIEYDGAGRQSRIVDRNGRIREFAFDAKGQLLTEAWLDGGVTLRTLQYSYDAVGNLISASDDGVIQSFAYDSMQQVTTSRVTAPAHFPEYTLHYQYDEAGNLITALDSVGTRVDSSYDSRNLLRSKRWSIDGSTASVVEMEYSARGEREGIERIDASGATVSKSLREYDGNGRTVSIAHRDGGNSLVSAYSYRYDVAGQIFQEINRGRTIDYELDVLGQLQNVVRSGVVEESFSYDAGGNRLADSARSYTVGAGNRLVRDDAFEYQYDAEGNIVRKTEIATGTFSTYLFDHRNRLVKSQRVSIDGTVLAEVSFLYDALDRRISVSDGLQAQYTVFDGHQPWLDLNSDGSVHSRYLSGDGIDELLARHRSSEGVVWYLSDRLKSVGDLLDSSGLVVNHLEYDSFGNVVVETQSSRGDRFRFTGREFDSSTGLYFYRARFYDPMLGRFLSEDPLGFSGGDTNLSRYVGNQPNRFTDPMGLQATAEFGGLLGAVALMDGFFLEPGSGSANIRINDECVTFCAKTEVVSIFGGDVAAQNAANYGQAALVLRIIDEYMERLVETGDLAHTVEVSEMNRMEGPLLWTQQARISVEAGSGVSQTLKNAIKSGKIARTLGKSGPTVCIGYCGTPVKIGFGFWKDKQAFNAWKGKFDLVDFGDLEKTTGKSGFRDIVASLLMVADEVHFNGNKFDLRRALKYNGRVDEYGHPGTYNITNLEFYLLHQMDTYLAKQVLQGRIPFCKARFHLEDGTILARGQFPTGY